MTRELQKDLMQHASDYRKRANEYFFKTGPGEYGEGDQFAGIQMPSIRSAIKPYLDMSLLGINEMLYHEIHEFRMAALLILGHQYKKAKDPFQQEEICAFYLKHKSQVNNWDLVDLSAPHILGQHTLNQNFLNKEVLFVLVNSPVLWDRRIAMVSTLAFIRKGYLELCFQLAELLLDDKEDLMHKALGWMLREAWKRDSLIVEEFIKEHYTRLPRTSLRYAIERMEPVQRKSYLKGSF